jgi:8-oxo-dGTP diphosphatase
LQVHHDYGDKTVLLDVHVVWEFSGEPVGLEDQPLAWVAPPDLARYAFPVANVPIVTAVAKLLAP